MAGFFDVLKMEILPDGTIKTTTDEISAPNHDNAEQFLQHVAELAGGETTRVGRHDHNHVHTHTHGGVTHSH